MWNDVSEIEPSLYIKMVVDGEDNVIDWIIANIWTDDIRYFREILHSTGNIISGNNHYSCYRNSIACYRTSISCYPTGTEKYRYGNYIFQSLTNDIEVRGSKKIGK
jgi:hypothetical protein